MSQQRMTGPMQYLLNRRAWKTEDDWLAAQVFREAGRWVENNAGNQPRELAAQGRWAEAERNWRPSSRTGDSRRDQACLPRLFPSPSPGEAKKARGTDAEQSNRRRLRNHGDI